MPMKAMLKKLCCLVLPAIMLGACGKSDVDTPSNLYQEYEVLVEKGGVSAFANLRTGGVSGERVRVAKDALTVNTLQMYYTAPESQTEPEFTYFATLASNHTKAIFRLRNSEGKTLVNTADFSGVPEACLLDQKTYEVHAGETVRLKLNGAYPYEVQGWLVGSSSLSTPIALKVVEDLNFSSDEASITLPQVTSGVYNLLLDVRRELPVTQGDGTAGGNMTIIRRWRTNVKF